jgi:methylthioribose-1-phosphate isomerase
MEEFTKEKKKQLAQNRERLIREREGFIAPVSSGSFRSNFDNIKFDVTPVNKLNAIVTENKEDISIETLLDDKGNADE